MIKKLIFILIAFLIQCYYITAQVVRKYNDNTVIVNNMMMHKDSIGRIPVDPADTIIQQIINNDFSFLIKDSNYYNFKVCEILKFKMGFGFRIVTKINGRDVFAVVISAKNKNAIGRKIKVGNTYRIKLNRYIEKLLSRSIEYKRVYDVMIGDKTMAVLSTGSFSYMFISQNFDDLYYSDSISVSKTEALINIKKEIIKSDIYPFIKSISFKEDSSGLINCVDTTLIIKSLHTYSTFVNLFSPSDYGISFARKQPLLNWENHNIDTRNFNTFFWGMIKKFYSLPVNMKKGISENDIYIRILYYSEDKYTVSVRWKLPSEKKEHIIILILKEINNKMKIIGVNKVY